MYFETWNVGFVVPRALRAIALTEQSSRVDVCGNHPQRRACEYYRRCFCLIRGKRGLSTPLGLLADFRRDAKQIVDWMGESFPTGVGTSRFFLEMRTPLQTNIVTRLLFPQRVSRPRSAQNLWFM